jgi:Ribosomal protein L7/L12 C-terminal domain
VNDDVPADIEALVRERRKIDAIKALRQRTGVGLKEAKDRIDLLERELGLPPASAGGRSLLFWLVLMVAAFVVWWLSSTFQHR